MGSVTGGGHGRAPRERGVDVVVRDMSEVGIRPPSRLASDVPSLFEVWGQVAPRLREVTVALLLDFDGTLSPIVGEPDAAELPRATRDVIQELAARCTVAVISGRDLRDLRRRIGLDSLWYAGSHGLELSGPGGFYREHERARDAVRALVEAERRLRGQLADIPGVVVERKRFGLATHYRMVGADQVEAVVRAVEGQGGLHPELRVSHGKCVVELRPDLDWSKGQALHRVVDELSPDRRQVLPLYAGDDVTDEDAFVSLAGWGVSVLVRDAENLGRATAADFAVDGPDELRRLLRQIAQLLHENTSRL